ncbi:DUF6415 family natural product biosynthesis protein [Streptomyces sp. NBC_01431]|uniref:DUF6415 family natural product biosynthesis protein n=1 Tax=Streptomyces sp. NBC_01431 TaxID=2903863 RepID=UPI002E344B97|nr:hypothetical protein [Streptomyces sp. NBC_01431]
MATTEQHHRPTATDIARDVQLAESLARWPGDQRAQACRERLRDYIQLLADPAETQVRLMPTSRARDVAEQSIRHARRLLADGRHGDPGACLALLAGAVRHLMQYAGMPR